MDKTRPEDYFHKIFEAFVNETRTNIRNNYEGCHINNNILKLMSVQATEQLQNLLITHNFIKSYEYINKIKQDVCVELLLYKDKITIDIHGYEKVSNFVARPQEKLFFQNKNIYIYDEV